MDVLIVGAGFAGATIARLLSKAGIKVTVIEKRNYIGGNCHTYRDSETGILVHKHGPHIFHTDDLEVWDFIQKFGAFRTYRHSVKTKHNGRVFSMPINLMTLNQLWKTDLSPSAAKSLVKRARCKTDGPNSLETVALETVGSEIFNTFFKHYSEKQWGCSADKIPASVFGRLPIRYNFDDSYFNHPIQAMPELGYTNIIQNMLDHPLISVFLNTEFTYGMATPFDHVFYSGPIDSYFSYCFGALGYRSLRFEKERHKGDYQGCAVMNYADANPAFTRITEHKHFASWEQHENTLIFKEYSEDWSQGRTPYYPLGQTKDKASYAKYKVLADRLPHVDFIGRLGRYQYLDMDRTIRLSMDMARQFIAKTSDRTCHYSMAS